VKVAYELLYSDVDHTTTNNNNSSQDRDAKNNDDFKDIAEEEFAKQCRVFVHEQL
jgi:hypothetical protein